MNDLVTETRDLSDFHQVSLSGIGHLIIEPGDHESVKVEAQADLLPRIITEVKGGRLNIRLKSRAVNGRWFNSVGPINYHVTVKHLDAISVSGAGKVTGSNLCSEHLDLSISGAAKAKLDLTVTELDTRISGARKLFLAGKAGRQELTISGAGKYLAKELASREALITISGTGKSTVDVSERLDVTISGCGKVEWLGDPEISEKVSGIGKVCRYRG
jgi:hypothetical protein